MFKKFMKTFGQEVKESAEFPDEKTIQLRFDLIREELSELQDALKKKDLKKKTSEGCIFWSSLLF